LFNEYIYITRDIMLYKLYLSNKFYLFFSIYFTNIQFIIYVYIIICYYLLWLNSLLSTNNINIIRKKILIWFILKRFVYFTQWSHNIIYNCRYITSFDINNIINIICALCAQCIVESNGYSRIYHLCIVLVYC